MKRTHVLIIGYGVGEKRPEAVSVNTWHTKEDLHSLGIAVSTVSVGLTDKSNDGRYGHSMYDFLFKKNEIITNLAQMIMAKRITHVVDMFVLPLMSNLITENVIKQCPGVIAIKELHNAPGHPKYLTMETLYRFVGNRASQVDRIFTRFDRVYTRNAYLSQLYKNQEIKYLPASVVVNKVRRFEEVPVLRCCYLGHPLVKKGIDVFPLLFTLLKEKGLRCEFHFAFSDIGPKKYWENVIKQAALGNGVKVTFPGTVKPADFFRKNDIYILPIKDIYGAVSTPNTILESMEAGCLVIATDIPSLGGITTNTNSIKIAAPNAADIADALSRASDNLVRKVLTKQARSDILATYSKTKVVNSLKEIYG